MASDDQKVRLAGGQGEPKQDALVAQPTPVALSGGQVSQRSGIQSGGLQELPEPHDPVWGTGKQPDSPSSISQIAALQSQLAQASQLRSGGSVLGAQPGASAPLARQQDAAEQYLVFSLLECECAFKAEHIQGVERLVDVTPVPNVVPWVRGVINLRGSVASVVDLRAFLDIEQLPYNPRTRLLSVQYNEMVICLVVDGVSEMTPIPNTAITQISTRQTYRPQWALPYAYGSALLDISAGEGSRKRTIVLLDAARLLFSDKMQHYSLEL